MFTRRSLFKRLAVAALAVPFVADSVAHAAPISPPGSVEGLAPAPVETPPATTPPLQGIAEPVPSGPTLAEELASQFHCPQGCHLVVTFSILDLAWKLMVFAPGSDHWRLAMAHERVDVPYMNREALVALMWNDAALHYKEYLRGFPRTISIRPGTITPMYGRPTPLSADDYDYYKRIRPILDTKTPPRIESNGVGFYGKLPQVDPASFRRHYQGEFVPE